MIIWVYVKKEQKSILRDNNLKESEFDLINGFFVRQTSVVFDREDNRRLERTQLQVESNFYPRNLDQVNSSFEKNSWFEVILRSQNKVLEESEKYRNILFF